MPPFMEMYPKDLSTLPSSAPTGDNINAESIGPVPRSMIYLLQVFGACFLSVVLAFRLKPGDFSSWKHVRQISLPRLSLATTFIFAWLFFVVAGILGYGIGLWVGSLVCAAGMYTSVSMYSISKIFVFVFLAEKVHVIWDAMLGRPRRKSVVYWLCMGLIAAYATAVVYTLCIVRSQLTHPADKRDADCYMELPPGGAITLMLLDVVITLAMTCMSIITVLITLPSSCANFIVLLAQDTIEHGWEFMLCWEVDLLINVIALFWATSGSGLRPIVSIQHLHDPTRIEDLDVRSNKLSRVPSWVSGWPDVVSETDSESLSHPDSPKTLPLNSDTEQDSLRGVSLVDSVSPPSAAMIQRHALWPVIVPPAQGVSSQGWQTPEYEVTVSLGF
ncbi:hypothetical protein BDY19DRAFT_997136 [Irpex rosettiformis]|uniref:Uncharacterized protein n=1 Tax=Irpex rosettiformis TaxID=378272 RepID=A0ACB8TSR7_9APHY|nr:hypothetical protein BDY19DRAFT_997136 [Irpex rosettiformis]